MTTRTRYFVIVSLLVLGVGLGSGLVAYYVGFPARAAGERGGPAELQFVPRDAAVIAFANVHEIMTSDLRQKLHHVLPTEPQGQREFQEHTGINLETDVDRIVACAGANAGIAGMHGAGLVLARGRFDEVRIESLMREHGAEVQTYGDKRLIVGDSIERQDVDSADQRHRMGGSFAASFIEPGLVALGSTPIVQTAIGLLRAGAKPEMQAMMQSLELAGTGKTVSLSFAVPAEIFDIVGAAAQQRRIQ